MRQGCCPWRLVCLGCNKPLTVTSNFPMSSTKIHMVYSSRCGYTVDTVLYCSYWYYICLAALKVCCVCRVQNFHFHSLSSALTFSQASTFPISNAWYNRVIMFLRSARLPVPRWNFRVVHAMPMTKADRYCRLSEDLRSRGEARRGCRYWYRYIKK